jgi:iron complex transport system substrate-binding protein
MRSLRDFLLALACLCLFLGAGWAAEGARTVVDSRGVEVQVPAEINRVVTIDDGLVEEMMIVFGVQDKLVGLGSEVIPNVWEFSYPSIKGENFTLHDGTHIVTYLDPRIKDLPVVGRAGTGVVNYEALVGLDPDVVILRLGDCTFANKDDENTKKFMESMESLGIRLFERYFSVNGLEISVSSSITVRSPLAVAFIGLGLDLPQRLQLHNLIQ